MAVKSLGPRSRAGLIAKPVDILGREERRRPVVGRTMRTRLHPKRSTDAQHRDEEDEGGESGWRRSVSRIGHGTDSNE